MNDLPRLREWQAANEPELGYPSTMDRQNDRSGNRFPRLRSEENILSTPDSQFVRGNEEDAIRRSTPLPALCSCQRARHFRCATRSLGHLQTFVSSPSEDKQIQQQGASTLSSMLIGG